VPALAIAMVAAPAANATVVAADALPDLSGIL
jgi:hypothetical protein